MLLTPFALISEISYLDISIVAGYILGITALGCYAGMRKKGAESRSKDYFLAGGHLKWPMIGLSLFATNISCYHLVGLAENGFKSGLLYGNFEWMAVVTLVLLSLFFAPFYLRSRVATLPEFLEKRFGRPCRDWLAVVSVFSSIIINVTFSFVAGGAVLNALFGWDDYVAILVIASITGLYTIVGGLAAVVWTETIQTVVLLTGATAITATCWFKCGGWTPLTETITAHGEHDRLSMLQSGGDLPWYSVMLGYPVLGIWYWCADQTIVQRVLGAKDENHARVGPLFAGLIKILPVFLFVLPGLFAWALWKNGSLDLASITDAQGVVNTKALYTTMIVKLLPSGLIGILIAALLAGLMSNVAASLNSISTLVSYDLYKRLRPAATDTQVLRVGRISAGLALLVGIAAMFPAKQYDSIFKGINDVIAHIAPPITCVFLFGIFWSRASTFAAKWTLWAGSTLGVAVFAAGKLIAKGSANPLLAFLADTPFMMMAFWLFCACCALMTVLSIFRPHVHSEESSTLFWKNPLDPLRQPGWPLFGDYRFLAAALLLLIGLLYHHFSH